MFRRPTFDFSVRPQAVDQSDIQLSWLLEVGSRFCDTLIEAYGVEPVSGILKRMPLVLQAWRQDHKIARRLGRVAQLAEQLTLNQ
jgi:hypothetical protein